MFFRILLKNFGSFCRIGIQVKVKCLVWVKGFTQDIKIVTYNKDIRVIMISLQGTEICEQDDRMNQVGTVSQSA